MDREKKKKGRQGNKEMKDVGGNEELQEKPDCLSNKGRVIEKRWMKRNLFLIGNVYFVIIFFGMLIDKENRKK